MLSSCSLLVVSSTTELLSCSGHTKAVKHEIQFKCLTSTMLWRIIGSSIFLLCLVERLLWWQTGSCARLSVFLFVSLLFFLAWSNAPENNYKTGYGYITQGTWEWHWVMMCRIACNTATITCSFRFIQAMQNIQDTATPWTPASPRCSATANQIVP